MISELIAKSRKESAENKLRARHNTLAQTKDLIPYSNCALTEMIEAINKIFGDKNNRR